MMREGKVNGLVFLFKKNQAKSPLEESRSHASQDLKQKVLIHLTAHSPYSMTGTHTVGDTLSIGSYVVLCGKAPLRCQQVHTGLTTYCML